MCDYDPKRMAVWSNDTVCPSSSGTCLDGACQCKPGYVNDFAYFRFNDCRVPVLFLPISDGIILGLSIIALAYSSYYLRTAKALARKIILSAIATELCNILFLILRFADAHQITGRSLIVLYFTILFGSLSSLYSLYSLAEPLCRMSSTPAEKLQKALVGCFVFFRVIGLVPACVAAGKFGDPTNPTNNQGWNISVSAFSVTLALEVFGVVSLLVVYGKRMIKIVDQLSKSVERANNNSTNEYLPRVKRFIGDQLLYSPWVFLVSIFPPMIVLSTHYIPYLFVVFELSLFSIFHIALNQTRYATVKKNFSSQNASELASNKEKATSGLVVGTGTVNPDNSAF